MKQGKKKSGHDEPSEESPDTDTVVPENRDNPDGIDAIRALQLIAGGIAILVLAWYVFHNLLHVI